MSKKPLNKYFGIWYCPILSIAELLTSFSHTGQGLFDSRISLFFSDYLVSKKTQYFWKKFSSPFFNVNIGIGQDSTLSLILSALYLSPVFHIFEKRTKNLKILIFFCYLWIMVSLLDQSGLFIKHKKTKVFHFSRLHNIFDSPPLDLSILRDPILYPKDTWHYLRFTFDRKLSFQQHIKFYSNKALWTVKCSVTPYVDYFPIRNAFSIEHVYFLLSCIVFLFLALQ